MKALVQRVESARVLVAGEVVGEIGPGLLAFVCALRGDGPGEAVRLAERVAGYRVFHDEALKMNVSALDLGLPILVVSQFTLLGDCRRGRRPSFIQAARPELADELYRAFCAEIRGQGIEVQTGRFQAHMEVELVNDGPVTLLIDSHKKF